MAQALYYPWLSIRDEVWLKTSLAFQAVVDISNTLRLRPGARIVLGLLLGGGFGPSLQAGTVEFQYGLGPFASRIDTITTIDFSETPSFLAEASQPGGDGESTYYEVMTIEDVVFSIVNANSNKPGMRRLTDIGNNGTFEFYSTARSPNFLIPGLGEALNNDDGIRIDLSSIGQPVTAFGVHWGSVQDTSPCCIVQLFRFRLGSGAIVDHRFDSGNAYQGRGEESSANTFFGFHAVGDTIVEVVIEQLGHNPVLDNVTLGRLRPPSAPPPPSPIVIDARDFGVPNVDPLDAITLQVGGHDAARRSIREMKPNWGEDAVLNDGLADLAQSLSEMSSVPEIVYYAEAASSFLRVNSRIFQRYADDPPRFDYDVVAEPSGNEAETEFEKRFGPELAPLDDLFVRWGYATEALDLALTTLERLQGAYLNADHQAFTLQADTFRRLNTDSDHLFTVLADGLEASESLLSNAGVPDPCIAGESITFSRFLRWTARQIRGLPTEVSLLPQVFRDGFEDGDLSAWTLLRCDGSKVGSLGLGTSEKALTRPGAPPSSGSKFSR
jgi:hypothetical protein